MSLSFCVITRYLGLAHNSIWLGSFSLSTKTTLSSALNICYGSYWSLIFIFQWELLSTWAKWYTADGSHYQGPPPPTSIDPPAKSKNPLRNFVHTYTAVSRQIPGGRVQENAVSWDLYQLCPLIRNFYLQKSLGVYNVIRGHLHKTFTQPIIQLSYWIS
jgi:hypothetical protein